MNPLKHSGDSANIASYSEERRPQPGRLWCHVLRGDFVRDPETKAIVTKPLPDFHFTVYREGEGETGAFRYTPKTKPAPGPLCDRTVTRLVRCHLGGADALDSDRRRCLAMLSRGPLYRGAVGLMLGGLMDHPESTLRALRAIGLVRVSKNAWTITEAGKRRLAESRSAPA